MPATGYPVPSLINPDSKIHRQELAQAIALLMQGKSNNTGTVTLIENASSTTLVDSRIGFETILLFMPTTANAAAEQGNGTLYVSDTGRVNGQVTISHANNAFTDRTFRFALIG